MRKILKRFSAALSGTAVLLGMLPSIGALAAEPKILSVFMKEESDAIIVSVASENTDKTTLVAAAYDREGSQLAAAEVENGLAELSVEGDFELAAVKVFCWKSTDSMRPLCEAKRVESSYYAGEFQVEEVDAKERFITGTGASSLDLDDDDVNFTIIRDGSAADLDTIQPGDIVTVLSDDEYDEAGKMNAAVYVSSAKAEGVVDEVNDGVYTIGGVDRKLSRGHNLKFYPGDDGTFYLNYAGRIAAFEYNDENIEYAYIVGFELSEDEESLTVEKAVENGTVSVPVRERADVISENVSESTLRYLDASDLYNAVLPSYIDTSSGSLAKIVLNDSGEIKRFYFPGAEDFYEERFYKDKNENAYSSVNGKYGLCTILPDATVFDVDTETGKVRSISTAQDTLKDGYNYKFLAYGETVKKIDCLVTYDAYKAEPYVDPDDSEDPTDPVEQTYLDGAVMVVTKRSITDDTMKITGFMDGKTTAVMVDPYEYAANSAELNKIEAGNVIIFSGTSEVTDVTVLLTTAEDNFEDAIIPTGNGVTAEIGEGEQTAKKVTVRFGEVLTKERVYFAFADEDTYYGEDLSEYVPAYNCRYILVEYVRGGSTIVKNGSYGYLKESTESKPVYAFIKTASDSGEEVTDIVIFKGTENL